MGFARQSPGEKLCLRPAAEPGRRPGFSRAEMSSASVASSELERLNRGEPRAEAAAEPGTEPFRTPLELARSSRQSCRRAFGGARGEPGAEPALEPGAEPAVEPAAEPAAELKAEPMRELVRVEQVVELACVEPAAEPGRVEQVEEPPREHVAELGRSRDSGPQLCLRLIVPGNFEHEEAEVLGRVEASIVLMGASTVELGRVTAGAVEHVAEPGRSPPQLCRRFLLTGIVEAWPAVSAAGILPLFRSHPRLYFFVGVPSQT